MIARSIRRLLRRSRATVLAGIAARGASPVEGSLAICGFCRSVGVEDAKDMSPHNLTLRARVVVTDPLKFPMQAAPGKFLARPPCGVQLIPHRAPDREYH